MSNRRVWSPELSSFIKICYTELVLSHEQISQLVRHIYGAHWAAAGRGPEEPTADTVMGHYRWRYNKGRQAYWPRIDPQNGQITVEGYNLLQQVRPRVHQALVDLHIPLVTRTAAAFGEDWAIVGPQAAPPGAVAPLVPAIMPAPMAPVAGPSVVPPLQPRHTAAPAPPVADPTTTQSGQQQEPEEDGEAEEGTELNQEQDSDLNRPGMVTRARAARLPAQLTIPPPPAPVAAPVRPAPQPGLEAVASRLPPPNRLANLFQQRDLEHRDLRELFPQLWPDESDEFDDFEESEE